MEEFQKRLESDALQGLINGEVGGEYRVLDILAKAVITGLEVSAGFQSAANFITAKSLISGKFPSQKKGRPKVKNGVDGELVAAQYIAMRSAGIRYSDAVAQLAATHHKDERHILRIVKQNKSNVIAMQMFREVLKPFPQLERIHSDPQ